MIKIAVVDDEEFSAVKCRNIISSARLPDTQVDIFNDGKHFSKVVFENKEPFDIIILDIDMPDITGFDIARRLREENPDVIIMFYTAHEQYVFKSFEFQPFRYIRKEYAIRELPFAYEQAVELLNKRKNKNIYLKLDELNQMISSNDIVYFETNGRRCDVVLSDNRKIEVAKSFNEIFSKMEDANFFVVHKGIAVNLRFVQQYNNQCLVLKSGHKLIISRRNYQAFKTAMMNYLRYEE